MDKKQGFLDRYNPKRDLNYALDQSWGAAVQHNLLYNKNCPIGCANRKLTKSFWKTKVQDIAMMTMDSDKYETAFLRLKEEMNTQFAEYIYFRVSHAQKGLSVYMKHLWCMGVISEPPQCPVDKIILRKISEAPEFRHFKSVSWTKVDSLAAHQTIIRAIKTFANQPSIAQWELDTFSSL